MTHEEIRAMLSAGEPTEEARAHVAACASCRAWSDTLDRIQRVAPAMFDEPPAGLSDRVVTAVKEHARTAVVAPLPLGGSKRSLWHHVGTRIALAAALTGIVAGALTIPGGDGPTVAVAAKRTIDARTARVTFSSSLTFRPARPIPVPAPDLNELRRSVRRGLPSGLRRYADPLAGMERVPRPAPIRVIRSSASGNGQVVFPDRLHLRGRMSESHGTGSMSGPFETIVIGSRTWVRVPLFGTRWVELPAMPFDIGLSFHPGAFVAAMRRFDGAERRVGEETMDGVRVEHYRYTHRTNLGSYLGTRSVTIDAWIDEDGRLRRIVEQHAGRSERGTLNARTEFRFSSFGIDATIEEPSPTISLAEAPAAFFGFGFGFGGASLAFSFQAAARMPRFWFPHIEFPTFVVPEFRLPQLRIPEFRIEPIPAPRFTMPPFTPPTFEPREEPPPRPEPTWDTYTPGPEPTTYEQSPYPTPSPSPYEP